MSYYIVVFRSRNETYKFANILNSYGFNVAFINTPRQISVSCGLSSKIDARAVEAARQILSRRQFYTFAGIYYFDGTKYRKI